MELLSRTALGLLSLSAAFAGTASAVESFRKPTVAFTAGNGTLLASRSSPVQIHADAADWPGVLRAAHDLALDFGRVTGLNGTLTTSGQATANSSVIFNVTGIKSDWSVGSSATGYAAAGAGNIIVGTIGNSSLIDAMIASGQLDVSSIEGQWETYVSTFVQSAGNGTGPALVIAGKSLSSNMPKNTDHQQEAIAEAQFTVFTICLSRLVYHRGTGSPMSRSSPGIPSTLSRTRRLRRRHQSSTVASSSTTRHLL